MRKRLDFKFVFAGKMTIDSTLGQACCISNVTDGSSLIALCIKQDPRFFKNRFFGHFGIAHAQRYQLVSKNQKRNFDF